MHADFLLERFRENATQDAIVWRGSAYTYQWLLQRIAFWAEQFEKSEVVSGSVVMLQADFSPDALAIWIQLIHSGCIVVPTTNISQQKQQQISETAQAEVIISLVDENKFDLKKTSIEAQHELYKTLQLKQKPGLVLFSSGSSGKSKAVVHDFSLLLNKFRKKRQNLRTLAFLLFDHIGGIDTLFYSLSNGSCLITTEDRSPDEICRLIETHLVQVLPVSPTFLNSLLLRESYRRHDLSSLRYITYGAEVMSPHTLKRCNELFPEVTFLQKYGTSEVGTLRSKSLCSDSLWVKIGGEGYETRVVDGRLQIKAASAMIGYLNAPSPFTEDGWFKTGDVVEEEGEYLKILGRTSDIINVGGQKVYPAEVEAVLQQMSEIADVAVYGDSNPIMGSIVCANVSAMAGVDTSTLSKRIKKHCRALLEPYKVPVKITIVDRDKITTARFKKNRK